MLVTCSIAALLAAQSAPPSHAPAKLPDLPVFQNTPGAIKPFNKNIWIEVVDGKARRVIVRTQVCRREVILEEFMCLYRTKEHESILSADLVPRNFHAALLAANIEPGSPATILPEFKPPTGDAVDIRVEWLEDGKARSARAQDWFRDVRTKKPTDADFVFAGSRTITSALTGQPYYLGNEGDLISVTNFAGSIVDLAVRSSDVDAERIFETDPDRVPPLDTEVFVILSRKATAKPAAKPAK